MITLKIFIPPLHDPEHPPKKLTIYKIVSTKFPNDSWELMVNPVVVMEDAITRAAFSTQSSRSTFDTDVKKI
jgi:hypothetical protein